MARVTSQLVDWLAALLDEDEREVVRGDLVELGASDGQALNELLGLVARRQAALWEHRGPWLALLGVALPLGWLLSLASRTWAGVSATYIWIYVNNWTWGYLQSPGSRLDMLQIVGTFVVQCLTLAGWAWTIGFALGSLARRAVWVTAMACTLTVFAGMIAGLATAPFNPLNAAVPSSVFYRVIFPSLITATLVVVPLWCGALRVVRRRPVPARRTLLGTITVAGLTCLSARPLERALVSGWAHGGWLLRATWPPAVTVVAGHQSHTWSLPLLFLPFVMICPAVYVALTSVRRPPQAATPAS